MQVRKPVKTVKQESPIKPWHIALFVLAIFVVVWAAGRYIGEERAARNATYDVEKSTYKAPNPKLEWRETEK